MQAQPYTLNPQLCPRDAEVDQWERLLDRTAPGVWILEGNGKTSFIRMAQARRPSVYISFRECASTHDLIFQFTKHIYQPLGIIGSFILSYVQLTQAAINLILGDKDADSHGLMQEVFFSLYLGHVRRAVSGDTTSAGPLRGGANETISSAFREPGSQAAPQNPKPQAPLVILDHIDTLISTAPGSKEESYRRILNSLFLFATAITKDSGAAHVVLIAQEPQRKELQARLLALGAPVRHLKVPPLSDSEVEELLGRLLGPQGLRGSDADWIRNQVKRKGQGNPQRIKELVAELASKEFNTARK
mmetsp:Transcript_3572/g.5684  ORF Transcript_3572/g.5684 Transcript_3572/m.5684 type:complete len:303 (-) Transcript_3572:364-1272(-)